MTTICVQFSDASEQTIITYFAGPQDPEVWPNQGEVDTSDPRYHVYWESLPERVRQFLPEPD